MAKSITTTSVPELIERYDALLIDAYGVLIDGQGALPGAPEVIAHLNRLQKPYWVVTNDASKLPATAATRYRALGLDIEGHRVITAGSLLTWFFETHGLKGTPCAVVGPPDSARYVAEAGGDVLDWNDPDVSRAEALIIGDEGGFDFMPVMNRALSLVFQRLDANKPLRLILPNPDLIYPASPGHFGFTAGSMAMWFEAAIAMRYPDEPITTFERLGKPYAAIFEAAVARASSRNVIMIGDQLDTDIIGARSFGIDAALVTFGLTRTSLTHVPEESRPTHLLHDWSV